uniref:Sushi domain-containing protein n=1 Tax=Canis lupus familiaris TaxID=9615 RepID=A0A8C0LWP2_CANLF
KWLPLAQIMIFEKCGPPPPIANGEIISLPLPVYAPGSSVEYQCQALYTLRGNRNIICSNGQWSEAPKCLGPCVTSEEIMRTHKIQLRWTDEKRLYLKIGDIVEFLCMYGYSRKTPAYTFRASCQEGNLVYPVCG